MDFKNPNAGDVAHAVEHVPGKHEALSSNPTTAQKNPQCLLKITKIMVMGRTCA